MYVKPGEKWFKHLDFILLDLLCIQISFFMAYCIRHGWNLNPYQNRDYVIADLVICFSLLLTAAVSGIYSDILKRGKGKELIAIVKHTVYAAAVALMLFFAAKMTEDFSRISFFLMPVIYIVLDYLVHLLRKSRLSRREGNHIRSFLVIADADKMSAVEKNLLQAKGSGIRIRKKVCMEEIQSGAALSENVIPEWLDEALIVSDVHNEKREAYENQLKVMGITIHDALPITKTREEVSFYEEVATYPTLTTAVKEATSGQALFKRMLDIIAGLVGSLVCILVLLVVAPIIWIKDPGPVIFKQTRIGKNGKKFKFLKIRSMYKDAEARKKELLAMNKVQDGMMFKIDNDPRILPGIGNFIRKTSLDEFPQFFNVLKGDMSLVGTRPPTVDEWEKYGAHHRLRLAVKPGITGMWQVSGRSNITDFEEVLKLDTSYIYNWTPSLDIKIIFKTIIQIIKRDGAE